MRSRIWFVILASTVLTNSAESRAKEMPGDSGVENELKFQVGDEAGNDIKALKTEILVMQTERKALEQLQKLVKRYAGTSMEPDILFRLAELYMRRARTERFFEIHKNLGQAYSFAPQKVKSNSETDEIRRALSIYQSMQEKFPRFRSMDIVIFNSAYAYQQLGEDKAAQKNLYRLVREYPDSSLVPDAYLAAGEIHYQHREFAEALENFKNLRRFPNSRVFPYGLYKAAWSYYNLQDAASGLAQLEEVVRFGRRVAEQEAARLKVQNESSRNQTVASNTESRGARLDLRKEALGDMALFFSDVKPSAEAVEYFSAQAQGLDQVEHIMRLVELYNRHSRFTDVEIVLKALLAKYPGSTQAVAGAHEELIWNFERMREREKAQVQLEAFNDWCDKQHESKDKEFAECRLKISAVSKKLATKWHAAFKHQGGPPALAVSAEKTYALYLRSSHRNDSDLPGVHFSYAELLFARGSYREASKNYETVSHYRAEKGQEGGLLVEEKVAHDSAYGAIFSLQKATEDKWNDEDEKKFIALAVFYRSRFPKGQYALDLEFKVAFIAYEKERYDEAGAIFQKIGWGEASTASPVPEKVIKAQDLYLDILNIKKDYTLLREAARSLMKRDLSDSSRGSKIERIYREAYFAESQRYEERGELNLAIEAYKKFALENADSELAPKAWWNASQLQFKVGDATGAANTCYQMHKLFPNSQNDRDCLSRAAQTFESMGRIDLAAKVLLNLAEADSEKQDHWREVAADFFALSRSKARALAMYVKLLESRKPVAQLPLLEKAEALAKEIGDKATVDKIELVYSQQEYEPHASRQIIEQAERLAASGELSQAFNQAKKVFNREKLPKNLLARARLIQAQLLADEYRKQSVKARVERIGAVLALKTNRLEVAQKAFQNVIRYGDADTTVRALRMLSACYLEYSKSVRSIQLPSDVPANDAKAFQDEIEQLAIPMEEKGIESVNQALQAARKGELRDGRIAEINAELNRLNLKPEQQRSIATIEPQVYVPIFRSKPLPQGELGGAEKVGKK